MKSLITLAFLSLPTIVTVTLLWCVNTNWSHQTAEEDKTAQSARASSIATLKSETAARESAAIYASVVHLTRLSTRRVTCSV